MPTPPSEDLPDEQCQANTHSSDISYVAASTRAVAMVDAWNLVTHFLTPDAVDAGRHPPGDYIVLCGVNVVPAAFAEPGNGHYCLPCQQTTCQTVTTPNRPRLTRWFLTRTTPGGIR